MEKADGKASFRFQIMNALSRVSLRRDSKVAFRSPNRKMLHFGILYVEDNEEDVQIMKRALQQVRHQGEFLHINTVEGAKQYLIRAQSENRLPDLVFVDLHIGTAEGRELIEFARANESLSSISYVFEDLDKAYDVGANLFLIKPMYLKGWTELIYKVRDYFSPAQ